MNYGPLPTAPQTRRSLNRANIKHELIALHSSKCAYCGLDVPYGQITLDSYLPFRTHPEAQEPSNYVLACIQCNYAKGAKEPLSPSGEVLILHPYDERYSKEIQINNVGIAEGQTDAGRSTIDLLQLNRPELVAFRKDHIADFIGKINDENTAYDVYKCSIGQIQALLRIELCDLELQEYFYRMAYANIITSMEAYLSKTIITIVLNDDAVFWRFVNRFDWEKEKFNIENIKDIYDSMNLRVQTKLTEILYHNIPKVKAIYKKVLEIDILQNNDDMTFLNRAIDIRHDLVHRNGRKSTSGEIDEFHTISLDMINELIDHVDRLVDEIEAQQQV